MKLSHALGVKSQYSSKFSGPRFVTSRTYPENKKKRIISSCSRSSCELHEIFVSANLFMTQFYRIIVITTYKNPMYDKKMFIILLNELK